MVTNNWKVFYGCDKWKDTDEGLTEHSARERYQSYCLHPPTRGGAMVKYVALYDNSGRNVQGFVTGGRYGKVE